MADSCKFVRSSNQCQSELSDGLILLVRSILYLFFFQISVIFEGFDEKSKKLHTWYYCFWFVSPIFLQFSAALPALKEQQSKKFSRPNDWVLLALNFFPCAAAVRCSYDPLLGWQVWGPISGQNPLGKTLHVFPEFKKMKGNYACNMYVKFRFL